MIRKIDRDMYKLGNRPAFDLHFDLHLWLFLTTFVPVYPTVIKQ